MEYIIEYKGVDKSFGDKQVLKDINLKIKPKRIVGIIGKNGSGKSTIFKLANDLLTPTAGEILVGGQKLGVETKKMISYLPERTYFPKNIKVYDAIKLFKDFYEDFDENKAKELLDLLDLDANMNMTKMSKGMKEKVQLVLVMARKAKLYILDEPLGGVDPATRDYILDTILSNFGEDSTMLISTHMVSDIERILDEVIIVDEGKIVLHEDADKLREKEKASIDEIFRRRFYKHVNKAS